MKIRIVVIGRVRSPLGEAVAEYERRAARYHSLEVVELREASGRSLHAGGVRAEESERIAGAVPPGHRLIALTRGGESWSSEELASYVQEAGVRSEPGIVFAIGGANGLTGELLRRADRRLALSAMTLPHELARLVLGEQLYRAGTILRGEPYHKGGAG